MLCDCEHVKHKGTRHHEKKQPTVPVKLIYGTYNLCKQCRKYCYSKEYRK